jgi:predicted DNA-binding transcriptional regulator AlpA
MRVRNRYRTLTVPRVGDTDAMRMLREFIAEHGLDNVCAVLRVSKPTIYAWSRAGDVSRKLIRAERVGWFKIAAEEYGEAAVAAKLGVK